MPLGPLPGTDPQSPTGGHPRSSGDSPPTCCDAFGIELREIEKDAMSRAAEKQWGIKLKDPAPPARDPSPGTRSELVVIKSAGHESPAKKTGDTDEQRPKHERTAEAPTFG